MTGKGRDAFQEVILKWEKLCFKGSRVCEKMKVGKVAPIQKLEMKDDFTVMCNFGRIRDSR